MNRFYPIFFLFSQMLRFFCLSFFIFSNLYLSAQTTDSINHNGIQRSFVYYTPTSWTANQQLPLLIVLHGLTQTGNGLMNITGFNAIAETNDFIVCYPDGINNSWNANMNVSVSQANDLGFIEELTNYFENSYNTNPSKRYLCGFSTGGFMCHKLACESSLCFAAIASVSGNMSDTVYTNCITPQQTSILHIHGRADPVVSYFGSSTTGVSVDSTINKWRVFLSCDSVPSFINMPNTNLLDLSYPEKYVYNNCSGKSLELIKIIGGGHQWPGITTLVGGLGNINMDFYSPQIIWEFLDGKACPQSTEINEINFNENKKVVRIIDLMGRDTELKENIPVFIIYEDGTVKRTLKFSY
ncbi:MAG: alpha/beta hydrolase-fold protein [Crocinitomicaceae bacterium]|nr:alpha/beta hydrolase-fold protein [Crocinitomicaceae bacterium]